MKRKIVFATVLAAISMSGVGLASAQTVNASEAPPMTQEQMFSAAKLSIEDATKVALKEVPGNLMEISFNDENGVAVYEAKIVGADGQASIVKIDAMSGAVLGKGLAANFDDEEDANENGQGVDSDDNEQDQGDDSDQETDGGAEDNDSDETEE